MMSFRLDPLEKKMKKTIIQFASGVYCDIDNEY